MVFSTGISRLGLDLGLVQGFRSYVLLLAGWAELEFAWLPLNPTVTSVHWASKWRYIHHMEEQKNNTPPSPHECTIWSHTARSHIPRLPGLQRHEQQGEDMSMRAWQGRDRDGGKAGSWKADGGGAPWWCSVVVHHLMGMGMGSWRLGQLQPSCPCGEGDMSQGQFWKRGRRNIQTPSTALISWFIHNNISRVHIYIINVKLSRYLSIHMQKAGIKARNTHNCYGGRMTKCT